jgi:hypothetical protein
MKFGGFALRCGNRVDEITIEMDRHLDWFFQRYGLPVFARMDFGSFQCGSTVFEGDYRVLMIRNPQNLASE